MTLLGQILQSHKCYSEHKYEQECVPVGCVPSTAAAISGVVCQGVGCLPSGVPSCQTPPPTPSGQNDRHM